MLIIAYDIANDKLRTKFSKYLEEYGFRLQYSVFQIRNSEAVLKNIIADIENKFEKRFTQSDSVIIFRNIDEKKKICFGYAKNNDDNFLMIM